MSTTRREVIQAALVSALALATPQSAFALQATAKTRFLVVNLKNGKLLAIDRLNDKRAFMLTRKAANGEHALAKQGSVVVKDGVVQKLNTPASTNDFKLTEENGKLVVRGDTTAALVQVTIKKP